jgi:hypothetical protein
MASVVSSTLRCGQPLDRSATSHMRMINLTICDQQIIVLASPISVCKIEIRFRALGVTLTKIVVGRSLGIDEYRWDQWWKVRPNLKVINSICYVQSKGRPLWLLRDHQCA